MWAPMLALKHARIRAPTPPRRSKTQPLRAFDAARVAYVDRKTDAVEALETHAIRIFRVVPTPTADLPILDAVVGAPGGRSLAQIAPARVNFPLESPETRQSDRQPHSSSR